MLLSGLLSLGAAASQAASGSSKANLAPRVAMALAPRQSVSMDSIPSQCKSRCSTIVNVLNTCSRTACLCTNTNANLLTDCVTCIVSIAPTPAIVAQGQSILDEFGNICRGAATTPSVSLTNPLSSASFSSPTSVIVPTFSQSVITSIPTTSSIAAATFGGDLPGEGGITSTAPSADSTGNPFNVPGSGALSLSVSLAASALAATLAAALLV